MSKRQDIIDLMETRFEAILKTGGYETDMGQNVFPFPASNVIPENKLPALVFRDLFSEDYAATISASGYHEHNLNVDIEVKAKGSTTATEVRKMMSDVLKAVGTDPKWSGKAIYTEPVSSEITLDQAESIIGGALIKIKVIYQTNKWEI